MKLTNFKFASRNILSSIFIALLLIACKKAETSRYDIIDFGAAEGKLCTKAIQNAIDKCSEAGGGTVYFPTGTFTSGTLFLKSNVHLYLEMGAVLEGSKDVKDYTIEGKEYGLIFAEYSKNISISGNGTINGNATSFMILDKLHTFIDYDKSVIRQGDDFMSPKFGTSDGPVAYNKRPAMMVVFMSCENISIKDITLTNSPNWTIRVGSCDNVVIDGIEILNNTLVPNSDGIHCTHSRNVRIANSYLVCGDDAIIVSGWGNEIDVHGKADPNYVVKDSTVGNKTKYGENVVVTNCVITSLSAGIRIGYGTNKIRNCLFSNIIMRDCNRGIGIFSRDSTGSIEDITFSNIIIQNKFYTGCWWGKGEPIHISCIAQEGVDKANYIKNITFKDISCSSETGAVVYSEYAGGIQNLQFHNVKMKVSKGKLTESYGGNFDLRPSKDKKDGLFKHDIPAFFFKNVSGLTMSQINVEWDSQLPTYFTNGVFLENVENESITNCNVKVEKAKL